MIQRRKLITLLSGEAAWPLAARAQQAQRVRRIGWLSSLDENDPRAKTQVSAFTQALADLGWTERRNLRMDLRWAGNDANRTSIENAQLGRLRKWPAIGPSSFCRQVWPHVPSCRCSNAERHRFA